MHLRVPVISTCVPVNGSLSEWEPALLHYLGTHLQEVY